MTPLFPEGGGRVQVAVGYTTTLNMNPQSQRIYDTDWGLLIFIYDEEGTLAEILFISFNELKNEERARKTFKEIKEILDGYGIDISELKKALPSLRNYCDKMSDPLADLGVLCTGVGIFLLFTTLMGGFPIAVGLAAGLGSEMWDSFEDAINLLLDMISEYEEKEK
jgi:hypothetical protein